MADKRCFLFLQGPHGPMFWRLAKMLRAAGAEVFRVGFNRGDEFFWNERASFIPFRGALDEWPDALQTLLAEKNVTDIVLYGDTRPIHATAVEIAKAKGLKIHVFEEGYLRPYWVSYERGGTNGNSRLMDLDVAEMRHALELSDLDLSETPAHWGDMRHHIFYGAVYHWFVMFLNGRYSKLQRHRELPVSQEALLYFRRLALMPFTSIGRMIATTRIKRGGYPYHLALMQLEHDASFQSFSPFSRMSEFIEMVVEGFAEGAPPHHHLVFKAHPLENGRSPLRRQIQKIAQKQGVARRVHYVRGGKLARLLDHARSAVTVNSTAAQQVLWRGIPLKCFGKAVFDKAEFVSTQTLPDFFAQPTRPDTRAYKDYRRFLLETSQVTGGFYSAGGRRQLMRQVVDLMLAEQDPYDALITGNAAPRQQLRVVT